MFLYNKYKISQSVTKSRIIRILFILFHSAAALKKHSGQSVGYSGVEHSIILVGGVHTRAKPIWAGGPLAGPWAGIYSYT